MNKQQKRETLEWLVNDTDPANYIVVDFEGGRHRKPTYFGTLRHGLQEVFIWRWGLKKFTQCYHMKESEFVGELNRLASTGRILVCYSVHDNQMFNKHFPGLTCEIKNVKPILQYAWNHLHPTNLAKRNLNDFYNQVCEKTIPGKGEIGPRVKAMFDQLEAMRYEYDWMAQEHKQTWEDYIEYNRADCQAVVDIIEELKRRLKAGNIPPNQPLISFT